LTQVIAFLNQKGGVGKTSCCFHLAGALTSMGHSVLMVDNDPQASLTQAVHGSKMTAGLDPEDTIVSLYREPGEDKQLLEAYMTFNGQGGGGIIPGSSRLEEFNLPVNPEKIRGITHCLGAWLSLCRHEFVLIDNPPNLAGCAWAALAAADGLVVPVQADDFGVQGLTPVLKALERVREAINPRLALTGILLTRYRPRLVKSREVREALAEAFQGDLFDAVIPDLALFPESVGVRRPVSHHAPNSPAAAAMTAVALELLVRLEHSRDAVAQEVSR
jgi:chromosome partitioning protein